MSETPVPPLSLTLFGPMHVRVEGRPLPHQRSRKALWLLALLTLRHGRAVEREWLTGMLWPDVDQETAFANLRPVLSELRRGLGSQGDRLRSPDRHTVLLDLDGAEVDLLQFEAAIARGTFTDLEQAIALYGGPLLEGCTEEWVPQERAARERSYLQALNRLGDASLASGNYEAAAGYYERAVRTDPWQEAARRGWMESLAMMGDANAALQVYREFLAFLRKDEKAVPDEQTRALFQRLRTELRQKAGAPAAVTAAAAPVPSIKGYLPHPLTELVGREDERLEVALQLRRSRLVTLTGTGGIGKTRLAMEVAREAVREYPDGVWLVALEALSEGRLVAQHVASVLGLREERERDALLRVTDHLRQKRLLLVLDNCEHLLDASVRLAVHLLRECAGVRILATSREALRVTGERVWSVPALAVPDTERLPQGPTTLIRVLTGYESVRLFVERAQAVRPAFTLTGSNARTVAKACRQLEGIPLAIELAAARARALDVGQITSRLEDYLGMLTGGGREAPSRQQTLRATLDWSYDLLTEAERSLLRRLSVFAGGCPLEAAERVCGGNGVCEGQIPDLLASLVDKSLVLFEEREASCGRYRLLEMVRQYAAESLRASGETEAIQARHSDWFLALAEEAEPELKGADQSDRLRRLETEHDNLRAALAFTETDERGAEACLRLAGALNQFWIKRGEFHEGRFYLERALEREGAQSATAVRAKAMQAAGVLAQRQGDYASARELHEASLTIYRAIGDKRGTAYSLTSLGDVASLQGDIETARPLLEEGLAIRRELGDRYGTADSLQSLGAVAFDEGDLNESRTLFEQVLAIRRELGDQYGIADSLQGLGSVAYAQRDYEAAQRLFDQGLTIKREIGDRWGIAFSLFHLGELALMRGDDEAARPLYEKTLAVQRDLGSQRDIALTLYRLGTLVLNQGDLEAARPLLGEGLELRRELGDSFVAHLLGSLGHLERAAGNYARATFYYRESLLLRQEMRDRLTLVCSLEDFACLSARQGRYERAVRLLGAAEASSGTLGRTLPVGDKFEYERTVAAARTVLNEKEIAAAWSEGRAMTLEQATDYALETGESIAREASP